MGELDNLECAKRDLKHAKMWNIPREAEKWLDKAIWWIEREQFDRKHFRKHISPD